MPKFAHVIVDVDVAHLDRPFDYSVPQRWQDQCTIGSLVRVKWGGRRVDGWVVGFAETSDHEPEELLAVSSAVPLFTESTLATFRYLALRFAATLSQVLSLALPRRVARVEKQLPDPPERGPLYQDQPGLAEIYPQFKEHPQCRYVVTAVPHRGLAALRALIAWATRHDVDIHLVVATTAEAHRLFTVLEQETDSAAIGLNTSDQSDAQRYATHLRALRGDFSVVIGTFTAVWTPSTRNTITVVWDDGNELHRSRRTPQVDSLDVALARCIHEGFGLVVASYSRSVKAQTLLASRWAEEAIAPRQLVRHLCARVRVIGSDDFEREGVTSLTSLPDSAYSLIRSALEEGPVLISVPGPGLEIRQGEQTITLGADRVGADLGRAFPHTSVLVSTSARGISRHVDDSARIVVATPGAEPWADSGYATVIITEGEYAAYSDRINAPEEALRRWLSLFAQVKPAHKAMIVGDIPANLNRALVLWNPVMVATHVLHERQELEFYPARWIVALDGESAEVASVVAELTELELDPPVVVKGTVARESTDTDDAEALFTTRTPVRTIVACLPRQTMTVMEAIKGIRQARSLRREPPVHVYVNPTQLF